MVDHATLTDPELHEPKGASTATSGQVYAANGSGSGVWAKPFKYVSVATAYSTGSPYAYSATTSEAVLNPTTSTISSSQFTVQTSPNFRLRYDGTETLYSKVYLNASIAQASGADRDLELVVYKNGSQIANSRMIDTSHTGEYRSIMMMYDITLATNDYIEIFGKGSASFTANFAKLYVSVEGHVV